MSVPPEDIDERLAIIAPFLRQRPYLTGRQILEQLGPEWTTSTLRSVQRLRREQWSNLRDEAGSIKHPPRRQSSSTS